jgi:2-dehydro-3-deoxy-D-arabinonate dehydratase
MTSLVRFLNPETESGARVGLKHDGTIYDITSQYPTIGAWLQASVGRVEQAIHDLKAAAPQTVRYYPAAALENGEGRLLSPVDTQEIWAAGVTYERSREARQQEAVDGGDVYARVYQAERPELFFKAQGWRVVGHGAEVGIRADATWSVPEAELGVVFNPAMEVVGFTVGNDMSSRDIEGANPLYLPQAKLYRASCALGMGIRLNPASEWPDATIRMTIKRSSETVFYGDVHTSRIRRKITELADYLGRSMDFPDGVVLLTGTGIVPPAEFTLAAGDIVEIEIEGIDMLVNTVKVV